MSCLDGVQYEKGTEFTVERLLEVTPHDVVMWFNNKVYGKPNPTDDDRPTLGRHSSLEYAKKALSSFFPNKHMQWNDVT